MATENSLGIKAAVDGARRLVGAGPPDRQRALERYDGQAETYHQRTAGGDHFRRQTVIRLAPLPGEVILDVGCGVGLNFETIRDAIGPSGRLIGVELNPRMLEMARARIERHGWTNVELVQADVAEADIPVTADGTLLCAVHDVMRSPAALANVLRHLRARARIVAGGPKWTPWRGYDALSLNFHTWRMNRGCVTTFEGFGRPWSHLERLVDHLVVDEVFSGGGYIACGIRPPTD
jgi:SAM-dependent methyltransferase